MTDKERLIELLKQKSCAYMPCDRECGECHNVEMYDDSIESLADYLLANGVIAPPFKIGQTVYEFECNYPFGDQRDVYVVPSTVSGIAIFTSKNIHNMNHLGKTVFLTKEEAEKCLKELGK